MASTVRSVLTRIGLTGRAQTFLASGGGIALLGLWQGIVPVIQFGALLATLPVAAAALTRGPGSGLELQRTLSSRELMAGDELRVAVSVRGRFPRGRSLLLEDLAPAALGGAHRMALNGMSGRGVRRPHYRLRAGARGEHHLGPMRLHVVDPFGMVHRVVTTGTRDGFVVIPRVVTLDPRVLGGATVGAGSGHLGSPGQAADDVIPRVYQPGDEVRRIDWKASARTDGLMVRSEENPWRSAVTIVVDMHGADHRGIEPTSSVDAALSVAASVGCLALADGWDLTVVTTDDDLVFVGSALTGVAAERRALLHALATVPVSTAAAHSPHLRFASAGIAPGPVVLVAGAVSPPGARTLSGISPHSPERVVVSIAADQWATPREPAPFARSADPLANGAGAGPGAADEAITIFRGAGWRISRMDRDTGVAAAWSALAAPR